MTRGAEAAADPRGSEVAEVRTSAARRAASIRTLAALAAGVVALLAAVLLPLAPVSVNQPVIDWPQDPGRPESTMLMLTAYRPLGLQATLSCRAARAAAGTGGIVLATTEPGQPDATQFALVASARDGRMLIQAVGATLVDEPLPAGDCAYEVRGGRDGLTVLRDGQEIGRGPAGRMPDVDALITSVGALPGGVADDLAVHLEVDDRFSTSPTRAKLALIWLLVLASAGCVVVLILYDATPPTPRLRWLLVAVRPVDLLVVGTLVVWTFLAPMTDDDGYYRAMAQNAQLTGYVGNYYQLHNNGFTPFTWFYMFLSAWLRLGSSPVVLRVPALVFGLATWLILRRFADSPQAVPAAVRGHRWGRPAVRLTLAVVFLAWWLPQDMGVRPETVVTLCGAGALLAVAAALERRRIALAGLAIALSGLGFAAHPTGFTALAPLLAAAPGLWRLVRANGGALRSAARLVCVVAPGAAIASLAGFADGSLGGFVLGQQVFLGIQEQESWYTEYLRYVFLLSPEPMGSYAKRAAVLVCLVGLLWFVGLAAAAAARRVPLPPRFALAGWATGLGFLLLWLTPSKWTHHFGSLAGVGSVFVALLLICAPVLLREMTDRDRLPGPIVVGAAGSVVAALALAGHGPNLWPYSWLLGLPNPEEPPHLWWFWFDQPAWWVLALVLVAVAIRLLTRRRDRAVLAIPIVVVGYLAAVVAYLVGGFGVATARTWTTWSPWAANVADPLATECVAASAIDVLDERDAVPLAAIQGAGGGVDGFVEGDGWYRPYAPPVRVGAGGAPQAGGAPKVWGSLVAPPGGGSVEATTGTVTTPWYRLPEPLPGDRVLSTLVAGRLGGGNGLTVEYGRTSGPRVDAMASVAATDGGDGPGWRTLTLGEPPAGADAVRLVGVDATADLGGWLALTAPALQRRVPLTSYLPPDAPVGVAWQFAFLFPCQRQPRVQDGITEPAAYAVLWGAEPFEGVGDNTWQAFRGGLFGQVRRVQSVVQVDAHLRDFPEVRYLQVYRFTPTYPPDRYTLSRDRRTLTGWQTEIPDGH